MEHAVKTVKYYRKDEQIKTWIKNGKGRKGNVELWIGKRESWMENGKQRTEGRECRAEKEEWTIQDEDWRMENEELYGT